jgi:hypothetical protein
MKPVIKSVQVNISVMHFYSEYYPKQEDALSPLLSRVPLDYAIRKIRGTKGD